MKFLMLFVAFVVVGPLMAQESPAPEAPEAPPAPETPAPPPSAEAPAPQASASAAPATEALPADVPEKHWAAGAVKTVLKGGLMDLEGGKFNGSASATKRDLAMVIGALLVRAGKGPAPVKPADLAPGDPAEKKIAIGCGSGGLRLKKGNKLTPGQHLIREDLAIAFSKLLAVVHGEKEAPVAGAVELNDVPPDSPIFTPIQRVLKAKVISLMNQKFEVYLPVPRFQLAAVAVKALEAIKTK